MESLRKVALVTGGAAGMGFAVASKLIEDGWNVAIVDVNIDVGSQAVGRLGANATFIKGDVAKYEDQVTAFEEVFNVYHRIDFVFANAGVAGKADFYQPSSDWPPKPPSTVVEEICLKGVIFTSYLAMHYMRKNKPAGGVIVSTASAASVYSSSELPMYTAAKHGVLGLMRAMSAQLKEENIRVNSILPGAIRTTLHSETTWSQFSQGDFTPIHEVVNAVLSLIKDPTAAGRALELSAGEVFDRTEPEFSNATMRRVMNGKSYKGERV